MGGRHPSHTSAQLAAVWYTDGLGRSLTILYSAQPFTEAYIRRPYALQLMLRGCNVLSDKDVRVLHIQQNLTGLPSPFRQAALALSNWVLVDTGAATSGHGIT